MKLVLASNNPKKLKELDAILAALDWQLIPQGEFGIAEAEEPHCTFVENALAKARHASRLTGGAGRRLGPLRRRFWRRSRRAVRTLRWRTQV